MLDVFTRIVGMSAAASVAVVAVVLLRVIFRRLSGRLCCVLWALVGLRLVLPFSFEESARKLFPDNHYENGLHLVRELLSQGSAADGQSTVNTASEALHISARTEDTALPFLAVITALWLFGAAVMLLIATVSYIRLAIILKTATRWDDGVYQSDRITYPFVFGMIRPKIYIPYSVDEADISYVLEHERTHIKRKDHIVKTIALAVLAVHWFNPLVWAAFILLCRDMEKACDESVIALKPYSERRSYSYALLSCSVGKERAIYPLAFGEVNLKERITHIMKYTKPAFKTNVIFSVLCVVVALCIFTLPVGCKDTSEVNADFVYGEDMAREIKDDGTVIMRYNSKSNVMTDEIQEFCFEGDGDTIVVEIDGGTVAIPDEDGRARYWVEPGTITGSAEQPIFWIPQELYDFNEFDQPEREYQAKSAVLTFTMLRNNEETDIAVITITADKTGDDVFYDHMTYTITVDDEHVLVANEDKSITIRNAE